MIDGVSISRILIRVKTKIDVYMVMKIYLGTIIDYKYYNTVYTSTYWPAPALHGQIFIDDPLL